MGSAQQVSLDAETIQVDLNARLARLRAAYEADPYPSAKQRKDRLMRGVDAVYRNEKRLCDALAADFGDRAELTTLFADVLVPIRAFRHAARNLDRWMKPEKRSAEFPLGLIGSKQYVFYQPLGVVGIVSPWNGPFGLAYQPLASAIAAGNRAIIKPSELTPHTSQLMLDITRDAFAPDEVDVVQGGIDVGSRFCALPFDHLLFVGSTRTARAVLHAAADNLTPVTLELGGKAPTIVAAGSDIDYAASKIINVKLMNGGQICMGADHALVHAADRDRFVQSALATFKRYYPDFANSPDVTRVFLPHQQKRLASLVQDAAARGAKVIVATGEPIEALAETRRFPLVLVVDPPADAAVMREEIFGPVLPVVSYTSLEDAVRQVRSRQRPLAIYHIGGSAKDQDYLLRHTHAGGMSFNDVMLHPLMNDLPFGGVGESGMGRHVGKDGFVAMSNAKAIAHRPWIDITKHIAPPYSPRLVKIMRMALKF